MTNESLDRFAVPFPTLGVESEPLELDPDVRAELLRHLDEIDRCRAAAIVSAQRYVIH